MIRRSEEAHSRLREVIRNAQKELKEKIRRQK
jgi:hypothetical protein